MVRLGHLEQQVMGVLWGSETEMTVRDVAEHFPGHAYTTLMTVMSHLERKGMVRRRLVGRAHHYVPAGSREEYAAELMREALSTTPDRSGALAHFAESVTAEEADLLRKILGDADGHQDGGRR